MGLTEIWFALFVIIIAGYLILDGFDMGVGILHLFVAKNDTERRILLNSIGPVWDGNEVWLVLGGGVLFAAFPFVYASMFSGFYLALMLVLFVMILRTVAIEFRSKLPGPNWRKTWDFVFWIASSGLALLLGVAFGNVLSGVPIDAQGDIHVTLIQLLTPFALLIGVTAVAMFAMHGGIFLTLKTEGELQARVRRSIPAVMLVFFILNTLVVIAMALYQHQITARYIANPWLGIFPLGALVALIVAWYHAAPGARFRRLYWFRCDNRFVVDLRGDRHLPELADLHDQSAIQLDHLQFGLRVEYADRDAGDRVDWHTGCAALYDRGVLLLPRQDQAGST